MKAKGRIGFPVSETNSMHFNGKQDKIEIISCQLKSQTCKEHLSAINKHFIVNDIYFKNKEFLVCIETLNRAYNKTKELQNSSCQMCAKHFQSVIVKSLENIQEELENMSTGIFRTKRYLSDLNKVNEVLDELVHAGNRVKVNNHFNQVSAS